MGLIACKDCKRDVSTQASKCPNCGSPIEKSFKPGIGSALLLVIGFFVVYSVISVIMEPSNSKRYSGHWEKEIDAGISRVLVKNGVTGCGTYKYKTSIKSKREHLVRCSRDGINWKTYVVWVGTDEVIGPRETDPLLD